eukprot:95470_1
MFTWWLTVFITRTTFSHEWISFPIDDLSNPKTQKVTFASISQLSDEGSFHIKNFLTANAVNTIKSQILELCEPENYHDQCGVQKLNYRINIFGDEGNSTYSIDHPRNIEQLYNSTMIGKWKLSTDIIQLYYHEPLLHFFEYIVTSTIHSSSLCDSNIYDCRKYNKLYVTSNQKCETCDVYVYMLKEDDTALYHFDRTPFSCVFLINKPNIGGIHRNYWSPPTYDNEYNWKEIGKILNNDADVNMKEINANEGDVFCFKGNISLHGISPIYGRTNRISLVMNYADKQHFANRRWTHDHVHTLHDEM